MSTDDKIGTITIAVVLFIVVAILVMIEMHQVAQGIPRVIDYGVNTVTVIVGVLA